MILDNLPKEILHALNICSQTAAEQNVEIYLVGGIVRDLLLGKKTLDIDVCLTFDAIDFANILEKKNQIKIIQTQLELRTAKVEFDNNVVLDLASTRKESYPKASHLPVITSFYCPLKEDISRRDFTVNSIAISLCKNNFGEITDLLNGVADLRNKKLRILHDNSFIDDPSRIIRALKYATRFDFELDGHTKLQMDKYLDNTHKDICYSRIMSEIKLSFSQNGEKALEKFQDWNLQRLFNLKKNSVSVELGKSIEKLGIEANWFTFFASIFIGVREEDLKEIFEVLNFENWQKKILNDYIAIKNTPIPDDKFETYNKFLNKEPEAIILYFSETGNQDALLYKKELEKIKTDINGNDLIALGIQPSKQIKTILNSVLKEKLNGNLKSKDDEISFIKALIKNA